ncbi:MAG: ABC transporter [Leptolyngbya sp. SIOISBB]|nr:ABC transporter [Leptolyngbya sp. SIOISBB]
MKRLAFSAKWLKFLTWPGLACATAGLVAGSLSGWQLLPTALMIFGIGLLLLGLSFSGQTAGAFWQQRSTQSGTNAVVATIAVLVILGLVNLLAVQNAGRYDLTETQLFTLAPATQQVVQSLDEPVRLVIFDPVQNPQDVQLLESYREESDNFDFEYVDPFANPRLAEAFGATQAGMVFLEVGGDRRFLQTIGTTANPEALGTPETLSEQELTNALARIVSDLTLNIYFVQGHGEPLIDGSEPGLSEAGQSLIAQNYQVETLNLLEAEAVPNDANVVVVAGPAQDFFPAEVEALEDYLNGGGGVLLLLDPRIDGGLTTLLDDWGVILDDRLVLDTSGAGQFVGLGPAAPIVTTYGDHPITQDFGDGRSFYPLARAVDSRDLPGIEATPLLLTNPESRAEAISDEGDLTFDPNAPPDGPYVLGVALSREAEETPPAELSQEPDSETEGEAVAAPDDTEDNTDPATDRSAESDTTDTEAVDAETVETEETPIAEPDDDAADEPINRAAESRLVVIGNSSFAGDGSFNQQLNGDVFLNSVNWLGQEADATLSIRPKTVTDRRLQMTGQQAWGLGVFSLLVLPLTGLALAILMALRRR